MDQLQHLARIFGVEIAGGLVRQHELRLPDQRTGDRHPLQLAARELARRAALPATQSDGADHARHLRRVGDAAKEERQPDVLLDAQLRQHVECLEDEAIVVAPQERERVVVQARELMLVEENLPGIDRLEAGDDIEQRRFADA